MNDKASEEDYVDTAERAHAVSTKLTPSPRHSTTSPRLSPKRYCCFDRDTLKDDALTPSKAFMNTKVRSH